MDEYTLVGRDEFLAKYGKGEWKARSYLLMVNDGRKT